MSYILDALKKSESERKQGTIVSLLERSEASSLISPRQLTILASVLLLNAVLLSVWLFWPASSSLPVAVPETANPNKPESGVIENTSLSATTAADTTTPLQTSQQAELTKPVPFWQLSSSQRAAFPKLNVTTHVYASDADSRAIVVNGIKVQEGESIGESLRLVKITEQGVIVEFQHRQIEIPVLQDW